MFAKPNQHQCSAHVVIVSPWKIREQRRQDAKYRDKAFIKQLQQRVQHLETQLGRWREWYYSSCWQSEACARDTTVVSPIDYSKWDHLQSSSDEEAAGGMEDEEERTNEEMRDQFEEESYVGSDESWGCRPEEEEEDADIEKDAAVDAHVGTVNTLERKAQLVDDMDAEENEDIAEEPEDTFKGAEPHQRRTEDVPAKCGASDSSVEELTDCGANNKQVLMKRLAQAAQCVQNSLDDSKERLACLGVDYVKLREHEELCARQCQEYLSMMSQLEENQFTRSGANQLNGIIAEWKAHLLSTLMAQEHGIHE